MIEKIEWKGGRFALILRNSYAEEGVNFITYKDEPLQLGVLKHKRGVRIKPHIHREFPRSIDKVQEVLHIESGVVQVEFYDPTGEKLSDVILHDGDTILLLSGGHGFNILKSAKIIEVKQGPYRGVDEDKQYLEVSEHLSDGCR
jgi:hypothetical protein